ncbi:hypothetical protein GCM10010211_69100 [Streptomyces albospinus]|uniref:Uncharacterized protein n=1 Tax=Streptomyces albospinus TaxID=285515 RepID=A0ABQ2VKN3_9ACTN|nr:hypothetical protein [Streptomyces albospinus]GGU92482.1 hypothetical protein GCM10010211_69100 [Streptomyces albospinus]
MPRDPHPSEIFRLPAARDHRPCACRRSPPLPRARPYGLSGTTPADYAEAIRAEAIRPEAAQTFDALGIGIGIGIRYDALPAKIREAVVPASPRPDFRRRIPHAFPAGPAHRARAALGNIKANVPAAAKRATSARTSSRSSRTRLGATAPRPPSPTAFPQVRAGAGIGFRVTAQVM